MLSAPGCVAGPPKNLLFGVGTLPATPRDTLASRWDLLINSELVRLSGMRWPVESAIEEGKGEVEMDHDETRTWRGWHHHMTQTFLAHHFLVWMRLKFKKTPAMTTAQARGLLAEVLRRERISVSEAIESMRYYQQRDWAAYRFHRRRTLKRH